MRFAGIIIGRPTVAVFELADDELALFQHVNIDLPQQTKRREAKERGGERERRMGFNPLDVRPILLPCS